MTNPAIADSRELPAPEELGLVEMGQMGTSAEPVSHEFVYQCSMCKAIWQAHQLKQGCISRCPSCSGMHFLIKKEADIKGEVKGVRSS